MMSLNRRAGKIETEINNGQEEKTRRRRENENKNDKKLWGGSSYYRIDHQKDFYSLARPDNCFWFKVGFCGFVRSSLLSISRGLPARDDRGGGVVFTYFFA